MLNRETRYKALIKSEEYKFWLNDLAGEIRLKCKKAKNEATVSSSFENILYSYTKEFFGHDIEFIKEEKLSDSVRHTFSNQRMDAVYNNLIIEYKHSSKLSKIQDIEKATSQTLNYLIAHLDDEQEYEAFLTDGQNLKFFNVRNNNVKTGELTEINSYHLDKIIKNVLFQDKKKLTGGNLAKDFIINSDNQLTRSLTKTLYKTYLFSENHQKTDMLFKEWKDLFHLSEADKGKNQDIDKRRRELSSIFDININNNDLEYKALFCLNTTYAIVVKLIAYKVLIQTSFKEDDVFEGLNLFNSDKLKYFFQDLEDGKTFNDQGVRNLLEGNYFSWYCDDNQWDVDIYKIIQSIISLLYSYEDIKFTSNYEPQDLFKDLYIGTIPKSVRHSFGEYFTPSWLADNVVINSIKLVNKPNWRGLDPTCGSGVFIVKMLEQIILENDKPIITDEQKKILLKEILDRVKGVDLNPLSVLTARVNYFIAISKLIDNVYDFEIPIYLGDSANLPLTINIEGVDCYQYKINNQVNNIEVILPKTFVERNDLPQIMQSIQTFVKAEKPEEIYNIIISNIKKGDQNHKILEFIKKLAENLVFLHHNKWDGIWVKIILNFLSTVKLGKFDLIVGNPPWVKWEYLPQVYASKIKDLCLNKHLFSGSVRTGGISLNICALIANTSASQWLNTDGVLAFLMPKTLMTQQSYEGFRNFYVDYEKNHRLFINMIEDWSESGHPFISVQEKFLTYYFKESFIDYSIGIPVKKIIKKKHVRIEELNLFRDFNLVKESFSYEEFFAIQLVKDKTAFTFGNDILEYDFADIIGNNFYKSRSGAEFTPAEIYFLKNKRKSKLPKTHVFEHIQLSSSKYKVIPQENLILETEFMYPVVKGPNITPFFCKLDEEVAIFPYLWNYKESISFTDLNANSPKLAEYLSDQKKIIERQSEKSLNLSMGNEFYSLSKIGAYTFCDVIVAFRDNTKMAACVITPIKMPWGEYKMPVCAKHAPYVSMTKDKRKITLDEAHFICGILNTNIVKKYISKSNDLRSFSIDFSFYIPEYDEDKIDEKSIVNLSKKAHESSNDIEKQHIVNQIEEHYLNICESR